MTPPCFLVSRYCSANSPLPQHDSERARSGIWRSHMASVVFGLASTRSPLVSMSPLLWPALGERDRVSPDLHSRDGNPVTYEELLQAAPAHIQQELLPAVLQSKYDRAQIALATLAQQLAQADLDAMVVIGNDRDGVNILASNRPAILVYRGQTVRIAPREVNPDADEVTKAPLWAWGREAAVHPVAVDLALHLEEHLITLGFDVADSVSMQAMAHPFGFVYTRLMPAKVVPIVPIVLNAQLPPNIPTPQRCFALGQAIRTAVEAWGVSARVGIVTNGGLSIGVLEEALDRQVLSAMATGDAAALAALPRGWLRGSSGEVVNWVTAAGALEHLPMHQLDYIPAYRSPAGTGSGLAFAYWRDSTT
ncbi:MAG: hypothetical protein EXR52_05865 [Dehalococcoidia bacterium]|nr:hypothetical protein [Dehalococcoidia bacterium]